MLLGFSSASAGFLKRVIKYTNDKTITVSGGIYYTKPAMEKVFVLGIIIVLLVLDWLALDDITTGNQPNFYFEYTMLVVSLLILSLLGVTFFKKKRLMKKRD